MIAARALVEIVRYCKKCANDVSVSWLHHLAIGLFLASLKTHGCWMAIKSCRAVKMVEAAMEPPMR